jgi:hypothetical protein
MPDAPEESPPNPLRLMTLRGAFVGLALGVVFGGWFHFDPSALLGALLSGVFGGGIVSATTLIELRARSRAPSPARNLGATLMALGVSLAGCGAAIVQVPYTVRALQTRSLAGSLRSFTSGWLPELARSPLLYAGLALTFAPIFAGTTRTALGATRARAHLELLPISAVGYAMVAGSCGGRIDLFVVLMLYAAASILLPLLVELCDRLEVLIARDEDS